MNPIGQAVASAWRRINARELVMLFVIAVFAVAFFIERGRPQPVPVKVAPFDSTDVKKAIADYQRVLSEKNTLLETILQLRAQVQATGGASWKPPVSPLSHDTVFIVQERPAKGDTNPPPAYTIHLYRQDMAFAVFATGGKVTVATLNPYYQATGQPYVKTYEFPRGGRDFQFASAEPSGPEALDGIKFDDVRRPVSYEGVWIGGGALLPRQFYGSMSVVFEFYERVQIVPMASTLPAVGVEVRYKLFQ